MSGDNDSFCQQCILYHFIHQEELWYHWQPDFLFRPACRFLPNLVTYIRMLSKMEGLHVMAICMVIRVSNPRQPRTIKESIFKSLLIYHSGFVLACRDWMLICPRDTHSLTMKLIQNVPSMGSTLFMRGHSFSMTALWNLEKHRVCRT